MTERTLRHAAMNAVEAYDRANPLRTADWHGEDCDCFRCEMERLRALLDAHTAEQPAPELCDVCGGHGMAGHPDSGYLCCRCHGSGGIKPAPDAVAEAARTEAAAIAELMRKAAEDLCQIVMKSATEYNIPQMALGAKACRDGIRDLKLDEIAKGHQP